MDSTTTRLRILWDLTMVLLAVASLVIIGWVEVAELTWRDPLFRRLAAVDLAIVAVFAADFGYRFYRAEHRARFLASHWVELVGLVPLYADSWSWFRFARLLRLAQILRLSRGLSAYRRLRSARFLDAVLVRNRLGHALVVSALIIGAMAAVVWILERDQNPAFTKFGDALWWAVVTATTVGYGDITPQSGAARVIAGALMLLGIGLIGMVTSSLSSALLTVGTDESEGALARAESGLADELERLASLRERGALSDEEFHRAKAKVLSA